MADAAPILLWFRDDLRLADNPALHAAATTGQKLICVYVLDDNSKDLRPLGGALRWWLHGALDSLDHALQAKGGDAAREADFVRGARLDPSNGRGLTAYAEYLEFQLDRPKEAALVLQQALKIDPMSPRAHFFDAIRTAVRSIDGLLPIKQA